MGSFEGTRKGYYTEEREIEEGSRSHTVRNVLLLAFIFVAVVYIGVSLFFIARFWVNTTINGQDVSAMSEKQAIRYLSTSTDGYTLEIVGREGSGGVVTAEDVGLYMDFGDTVGSLLKNQNPFLWLLNFFSGTEYTASFSIAYDDAALRKAVDSTGIFDSMRQAADAELSEFGEGGYQVVQSDIGTSLDREAVYENAERAVSSLQETLDLEAAGCYTDSSKGKADPELNLLADNLNRFVNMSLTYTFGDQKEVLDGATIKDWLTVSGTDVTLDEEKPKEFVTALAKKYDTFGISRKFKTHTGKTITVAGGDYGWWMDRPNTTAELIQAIYDGVSRDMKPVYFQEAASYGEDDIGNSYAEIDLDNQHVYIYKNGSLVVDTDCVSGRVIRGDATPNGTYSITYKERDAVLVGETYRSPVDYWMPFNGNIGMHDASWRSAFGGEIYVTKGSNGCINLPTSVAPKVYDNVEKGEAVVVYGGKQKKETPVSENKAPETPALTPEQQLLLQLQQRALAGDPAAIEQLQALQAAAAAAAAAAAGQ